MMKHSRAEGRPLPPPPRALPWPPLGAFSALLFLLFRLLCLPLSRYYETVSKPELIHWKEQGKIYQPGWGWDGWVGGKPQAASIAKEGETPTNTPLLSTLNSGEGPNNVQIQSHTLKSAQSGWNLTSSALCLKRFFHLLDNQTISTGFTVISIIVIIVIKLLFQWTDRRGLCFGGT